MVQIGGGSQSSDISKFTYTGDYEFVSLTDGTIAMQLKTSGTLTSPGELKIQACLVGGGGSGAHNWSKGSDGGTTYAFGQSSLGGKGGLNNNGGDGGSGGGQYGAGGSNGSDGTGYRYHGGTGQGTTTYLFGDPSTNILFAGGGGGGGLTGYFSGGSGGGGRGGRKNVPAISGTSNLGGGGGGCGNGDEESDYCGGGGGGYVNTYILNILKVDYEIIIGNGGIAPAPAFDSYVAANGGSGAVWIRVLDQ